MTCEVRAGEWKILMHQRRSGGDLTGAWAGGVYLFRRRNSRDCRREQTNRETGDQVMRPLRAALAATALVLVPHLVKAQATENWDPACGVPDTTVHHLPFTHEENLDGAKFIWFTNCRAGHRYP